MRMKLRNSLALLLILGISFSCADGSKGFNREEVLSKVELQLQGMVEHTKDSKRLPRCTNEDGTLRMVSARDWTSGFFPGMLWLQYEISKDGKWKSLAEQYTARLEKQQFNTRTHDTGFMMYCSYGTGYRINPTEEYKQILIQTAKSLMHTKIKYHNYPVNIYHC